MLSDNLETPYEEEDEFIECGVCDKSLRGNSLYKIHLTTSAHIKSDLERELNLEISPLCDKQTDSVPAVQIGFISYIVEPLFDEWQRFTEPSPLSQLMISNLHKNKARWSRLRCAHTPPETQAEEPEPEEGDGEGEDIP